MHAVCQITGGSIGTKTTSYAYDANGNMSSGDGRSITWSAFNKPVGISQGANSATLGYGPERQLLTRIDDTNGQVTSTVHVGGGYEKVTLPGGAVEERHTVGGNTLVTYTNRTAGGAGTIKTRYLLKDHLGSVTAITDEAGDEVEAFSFDACHILAAPLEQTDILLEDVGRTPKQVIVDLGYRGVDADNPGVEIVHRGRFRSMTNRQRRWLKRRQAIEPTIGHLKADHRMNRCWLAGRLGDALHTVLCAAGYNLRWLLRAIVAGRIKRLFFALHIVVLQTVSCVLAAISPPDTRSVRESRRASSGGQAWFAQIAAA